MRMIHRGDVSELAKLPVNTVSLQISIFASHHCLPSTSSYDVHGYMDHDVDSYHIWCVSVCVCVFRVRFLV